jgi:hypothetical protein
MHGGGALVRVTEMKDSPFCAIRMSVALAKEAVCARARDTPATSTEQVRNDFFQV